MILQSSIRKLNNLPLEQVCQTIVDTVGKVLRVDIAILCLNNLQEKYFVYQKNIIPGHKAFNSDILRLTIQKTENIAIVEDHYQNWQENQDLNSVTSLG